MRSYVSRANTRRTAVAVQPPAMPLLVSTPWSFILAAMTFSDRPSAFSASTVSRSSSAFASARCRAGRRAKRLLENGREAASLVARRRIVVQRLVVARRIGLPPTQQVEQLVADLLAHRAAE